MVLKSALFWDVMHRAVVIPYWRFGTTYRSHLQESGNRNKVCFIIIIIIIIIFTVPFIILHIYELRSLYWK